MTFYEITEKDQELIRVALECLERNFDDGVYNHTVGCALLCGNGKRRSFDSLTLAQDDRGERIATTSLRTGFAMTVA